MPTNHNSPLEAALSYYSHIVTVNAEGDSSVSEDTLEGLGTKGLLLNTLFGSILRLAQPPPTPSPSSTPGSDPGKPTISPASTRKHGPYDQAQSGSPRHDEMAAAISSYPQAAAGSITGSAVATTGAIRNSTGTTAKSQFATSNSAGTHETMNGVDLLKNDRDCEFQVPFSEIFIDEEECEDVSEPRLMSLLPEPGYFAAGALSGGISRTATAPIDRLKVYLLVDSKSKTNTVLTAAKSGYGLAALRQAGTPVTAAVTDLYKTGGLRTFFAGKHSLLSPNYAALSSVLATTSLSIVTTVSDKTSRKWIKRHKDHA